jgi:hypothetical protein
VGLVDGIGLHLVNIFSHFGVELKGSEDQQFWSQDEPARLLLGVL